MIYYPIDSFCDLEYWNLPIVGSEWNQKIQKIQKIQKSSKTVYPVSNILDCKFLSSWVLALQFLLVQKTEVLLWSIIDLANPVKLCNVHSAYE